LRDVAGFAGKTAEDAEILKINSAVLFLINPQGACENQRGRRNRRNRKQVGCERKTAAVRAK